MKDNPSDALFAELTMARPGHPAWMTTNKRLFYKRQEMKGVPYHGLNCSLDDIEHDQPFHEDKDRSIKEHRLSEMEIQSMLTPLSSYSSAVGKICPPHLQKIRSNNKNESHDDPKSSQA